jgi:methyl-accepting chemotaxis protein
MSPDTTPAPAGRPYKRRTLVINGPFQYKFISVVMACVAVAIVIIAADMFTSLGHYVNESAQGVDMKAVYQDSWMALLVKVAVYMAGVFVVSLVVSHRIAGPLYRFEKSAEDVAKGNLMVRVFLRKDDELGGFRESFNGMVDALREKVAQDVSRAQAAKRLLEELAAEAGLPEAAREKARKALAEASSIGDRFKLS